MKKIDISKIDIDRIVAEFVKQNEQREKEKLNFINTKQDEVMQMILEYLIQENNVIDSEGLLYFPEEYQFSSNELRLLLEVFEDYAVKKDKLVKLEDDFPEQYFFVKYKKQKLSFRKMFGQGVCEQIILNDTCWDEKMSFSYKKFKKHYKKENKHEE